MIWTAETLNWWLCDELFFRLVRRIRLKQKRISLQGENLYQFLAEVLLLWTPYIFVTMNTIYNNTDSEMKCQKTKFEQKRISPQGENSYQFLAEVLLLWTLYTIIQTAKWNVKNKVWTAEEKATDTVWLKNRTWFKNKADRAHSEFCNRYYH